jgi:ABC-type transporter Mla maintaining outer membrane lipid asymmetry ATPase subunit MlaF
MCFGGKQVLDHVSLAVAPQERLVIIGQSGAGKTTILRLILGILKRNAGSVFFKQHEVSRMNDHQLEQVPMRMGMVYQDAAFLSSFTVRENLALPLQELSTKTSDEINRTVDSRCAASAKRRRTSSSLIRAKSSYHSPTLWNSSGTITVHHGAPNELTLKALVSLAQVSSYVWAA